MGIGWMWSLRPELNRKHRYAIGIPIEGGNISPIKSYNTIEELEESFIQMYQFAINVGITEPVPIEKMSKYEEWGGAKCIEVSGLMEKISE